MRGAPAHVRCDNGPEMTAHALIDWCASQSTLTRYIDPGAPWQNAFVESFHSSVRDELLNVELFSCLAEARVVIEDWREDYNTAPAALRAGPQGPRRLRVRLDSRPARRLTPRRGRARTDSTPLGSPSGLAFAASFRPQRTYRAGTTSTRLSKQVDRRAGSA